MADADAYTRLGRSPVNVVDWGSFLRSVPGAYVEGGAPTDVSGSYQPTKNDAIRVNIPPNPAPADIFDTLKHELVHKALMGNGGAGIPTDYKAYQDNFRTVAPLAPLSGIKGLVQGLMFDPFSQPGPNNSWDFNKTNRAGDPYTELPAYMSIFNPNQMPQVSPRQRNAYMEDLFNYLKKRGATQAIQQLQYLLKGREAYNGTGMLPARQP